MRRILDEERTHASARRSRRSRTFENRGEAQHAAHRHRETRDQRHRIFETHTLIARQKYADLVAEFRQRLRQRTEHIGESAGLGERHALGGGHEDAHYFFFLNAARSPSI